MEDGLKRHYGKKNYKCFFLWQAPQRDIIGKLLPTARCYWQRLRRHYDLFAALPPSLEYKEPFIQKRILHHKCPTMNMNIHYHPKLFIGHFTLIGG